jgi:hypothetical protein
MKDTDEAEMFRLARPRSEFLAECKRRYTAVLSSRAAQERHDEERRKSENLRLLELRRVFGGSRRRGEKHV